MQKGFVYILECSDSSYYTGSTIDIEKRLNEHQDGKAANHTKKNLPVRLVYVEEFQRIDDAFYREKQIQGWSRKKKEALINGKHNMLPELSLAYRDKVSSRASDTTRTLEFKNSSSDKNTNAEALEASRLESLIFQSHSNGKLLITAEYLVLDGANALALPTKLGQSLSVNKTDKSIIRWTSLDYQGNVWFEDTFAIKDNQIANIYTPKTDNLSSRLIQILNAALELNSNLINIDSGYIIKSELDFPRQWGLGTSSTLINNIAQWANINPYKLLKMTFGGSGYDIACAQNNSPITYKLLENNPIVAKVNFNPSFKEELYFVHLNKKQDSREGIAYYKANRKNYSQAIEEVNHITKNMIDCESITAFKNLINDHEDIISKVTHQKPVKQLFFNDFDGSIKSLGAWGGDFILVASEKNPKDYFKKKGFHTILSYSEIIL